MNKKFWRDTLKPFTVKSNCIATWQVTFTSAAYFILWYFYSCFAPFSDLVVIPFIIIMALFILRFFVLMHDCGHGSLFKSSRVNKFVGYLLGVMTGMPQYVWSKHHAYHHATNGNWEKYKGPLRIISIERFSQLTTNQRLFYRIVRHPLLLISIGGFLYLFFNPRVNWMVGLVKLSFEVSNRLIIGNFKEARQLLTDLPSKKWNSSQEFWHMTYNNVTLFFVWYFMTQALGTYYFFLLHVSSLSLAGGLGILLFAIQHNFEHSYASNTENVDFTRASIEGTSYLKLPVLLNWFTANIAYHHIHHLSTSVPNYRLKACHRKLKPSFDMVRRIGLDEMLESTKYLLWDIKAEKLITIAEFESLETRISKSNKLVSQ